MWVQNLALLLISHAILGNSLSFTFLLWVTVKVMTMSRGGSIKEFMMECR